MIRWGIESNHNLAQLGSPLNRLSNYWIRQAAWTIVAQKSIMFETIVHRQIRNTSQRSVCAPLQAAP
jgi:hypothetical protein